MKNLTAAALIALTIACATFGQTSADFKSKYRQVISYEISPGVIATPNYTTDGQVCRIVVEKRMADNGRIIFGSSFSNAEVKEIVDELVPPTSVVGI